MASALAMIMNFPSHSKAKLLLPDRESTKGEKKQVRASSSAAVALERPCSPQCQCEGRSAEQRPLSLTSPMGGREGARAAGRESKKLKGVLAPTVTAHCIDFESCV